MDWEEHKRRQQASQLRSWGITIWFGIISIVFATTATVSVMAFNVQGELQYLIGAISSGMFALLAIIVTIQGKEPNWREIFLLIVYFWRP